MSFDWKEYCVLADELHTNCRTFSNEEACLRAAISRGYYAAFCTARSLARDVEGLQLQRTGADHAIVMQFYKSKSDSDLRRVGVLLSRLKDQRGRADYDDAVHDLSREAEAAIRQTKKLISLLSSSYENL